MADHRLVLISDTHLSRTHPLFFYNWTITRDWIAEQKPDLVLSLGDVSLNGAGGDDDLVFARMEYDRLPVPWAAVPGNHDVGNNLPDLRGETTVDAERVARYRRHFGADHWRRDLGDWSFVGINSLLLGSGMADEADQAAFLAETIAEIGARAWVLCLHKPLYLDDPLATDLHQGCIFPEPRAALEAILAANPPRMIISGHNHELWRHQIDGRDHLWCPATAFVSITDAPQRGGGAKQTGFYDVRLSGETVDITSLRPDGFISIDIGSWLKSGIGHYATFCDSPYPSAG
ncbi:MAG: metallophosphoesterase [Pseudomonadota bacterium]